MREMESEEEGGEDKAEGNVLRGATANEEAMDEFERAEEDERDEEETLAGSEFTRKEEKGRVMLKERVTVTLQSNHA